MSEETNVPRYWAEVVGEEDDFDPEKVYGLEIVAILDDVAKLEADLEHCHEAVKFAEMERDKRVAKLEAELAEARMRCGSAEADHIAAMRENARLRERVQDARLQIEDMMGRAIIGGAVYRDLAKARKALEETK